MKQALIILAAALLLASIRPAAATAAPYEGYVYSWWGEAVHSPIAYLPSRSITGQEAGGEPWQAANDLFAAADGSLYVLDSGSGTIIVLDREWQLQDRIYAFERDGEPDSFRNPEGLFVTPSGHIYVADTDNSRIVELGPDGEFVREIGAPQSDVLSAGFTFFPRKVIVDKAGRIYVIARGVFDGIIEFDSDGVFTGFMGTNRVAFDPIDLFWKTVSTQEQRDKMIRFVPIEFNNLALDGEGFIYTTTADRTSLSPVKRLNPSGIDVLRITDAYLPPIGDYARVRSTFVDIDAVGSGVYRALDSTRGRVFTYNEDGSLLYVVGGLGNQRGTFRNPVALANHEDRLYVLDRDLGRITEFAPTRFGELVNEANALYAGGKHHEAAELWQEVIKLDANYEMAYVGIGKSLLRQGEFKQALTYLKLGNDRIYYSKALAKYRREYMQENFGFYMTILLGMLLLVLIGRGLARRQRKEAKAHAVSQGS